MSKTQEPTHSAHSQLSRLTLKATGQASPRRTKNTYDPLDRLVRRGSAAGATTFGYSARGLSAQTNEIGAITRFVPDAAGRRLIETNANQEVLYYTNSAAGDLLALVDGKGQVTRWNYDAYGRVTNKLDQAGNEILRYAYDPDHRLTNRWSAAKGNTQYRYDALGNLTNVIYAFGSGLVYQHDPLNRLTNMVDAVGTTRYTYTPGGRLRSEDGPFADDTLTNGYWGGLRWELSLQQPSGFWTNAFGYDQAGRLTNVSSPAGAFGYLLGGTAPASPLISRIALPNTSHITNLYDGQARLGATYLINSGGTLLDKADYDYNAASQRVMASNIFAERIDYAYDPLGQLRVADSSVNSLDRGYAYDPAWNLAWRTNAGTAESFAVDSRNQLTSVPGGAVAYDSNGNMVSTDNAGRRYAYDAENQLVTITVTNTSPYYRTTLVYDGLLRLRQRFEYTGSPPVNHTNPPPDDPASALLFALEESQSDPGTITWTLNSETRYLYDGMRVIQERDGYNTPTVSYTRGTDLGGSLEGAGGIGGLLGRSHGYSAGNWTAHNYYHADGNGNITALVGTNQSVSARYAYDPFGNITASSGALAAANVYRFSSKEQHAVSGFYYYGYRWYAPGLQRWLNQDPIGELGGINLYNYVGNNPVNRIDPLGLAWYDYIPGIGPGIAQARGEAAIQAQLARYGYGSMQEFQLDHPGYGGTMTSGNLNAIQGTAQITGGAANLYVTGATAVTPTAAGTRCVARLTQRGLEHIAERHLFTSGAQNAGKFAEGTGARAIRDLINEAVAKGAARPNTLGRPGQIFEYNFGRTIGTDIAGNAASNLRVVVNPAGEVVTAFPY